LLRSPASRINIQRHSLSGMERTPQKLQGKWNEISTEPLTSITDWTRGEVISLIRNEDVVHLDDLFQRRSSIAWVGALNLAVLDEMAAIVAHELGWSEDRKSAEIQRTIDEMREKHGIVLV